MVQEEHIPQSNGIKGALNRVDFGDTFATTNHKSTLEEVVYSVFHDIPAWVQRGLHVRNFFVQFLGLKTRIPADYCEAYRVGAYVRFFKIYSIGQDEVILGLDDKHLNFRVSVLNSRAREYNIKVTTLVQIHNRFGRVYMSIIKPFHKLALRSMIKRTYKLGKK